MRGVTDLITKINTIINSGTASELQLVQLSAAVDSIEKKGVASVATPADLPNPVNNKGRFLYVKSTGQYTYSNGVVWDITRILRVAAVPLWSWGTGSYGRLGDNTTTNKSSPVSVIGGFADWVQVSGGAYHSVGVRANGTAWGWGKNGPNSYGRLGDGTTVSKMSPVSVVGGFTNWVQVSAGNRHTVGLRANGTAWAWGSGINGQLGADSAVYITSPVSVVGGFTDWVQVSAGREHTAAIRANGTAWAWGYNGYGNLGDGTTAAKTSPVSVIGGFTDWVQVSANSGATSDHTVGLRSNGTTWAWGRNDFGQLGDGTATNRSSPVSVVGGFTDWVQVSAGGRHTAGLRANGTAWAWGLGSSGQLGDNSPTNKSSPVSVVGGFTDWVQVSSGADQTIGLRSNGTAWAWGSNASGQLGDNTTTIKSSPVSVVGGFTDWVQVDAGSNHTVGIRAV